MGSCLSVCSDIFKQELVIHGEYIKDKYLSPTKPKKENKIEVTEKFCHEINKNVNETLQ